MSECRRGVLPACVQTFLCAGYPLPTCAGSVGIRWFAPVLDPAQLRAAGAPAPAAPTADGSPVRSAAAAAPEPAPERRSPPGGKQSLLLHRPARRPSGDLGRQA